MTTDQLPPLCPLREAVLARYAAISAAAAEEQSMELDEVLGYLAAIDRYDLKPLEAVLVQTEAIGDPTMPAPDQVAILEWLGDSFENWLHNFPLEQPLADTVRQMLPVAAALAITEPKFLIPGEHPLHTLLDTIQEYAIGWQPSLGRAGNTLQKQVDSAVEKVRGWFDNRNTDLASVCAEVSATAERDRSRARRMSQRVMETEQGRLRAAEAKNGAARMINRGLGKYQAPAAIGEFLKGPWYDSAQLVFLKFGADSEQWKQMTATTETLLDSMQVEGPQGENRRQYLFEVVTRIPKDLKRWLLSLQHDADAANEAVQPVEFSHLRILRQLKLDLVDIDTIELQEEHKATPGKTPREIAEIEIGQWFRVQDEADLVLRVQLALKLEGEQQLLFSNQAGVKALQLDYASFSELLAQERAVKLQGGGSFSQSLARAAGIESDQALEELTAKAAEQSRRYDEQLQEDPSGTAGSESQPHADQRQQPARELAPELVSEQELAPELMPEDSGDHAGEQADETAQDEAERETVEDEALHIPTEQAEAPRLPQDRLPQKEAELATAPGSPDQSGGGREGNMTLLEEAGRLAPPQRESADPEQEEGEEQQRHQREREVAEARAVVEAERHEREEQQRLQREQEAEEAREKQENERREREERERRQRERWEAQAQAREEAERRERETAATSAPDHSPETVSGNEGDPVSSIFDGPAVEQQDLQLPMGAWLGFHDGDAPLMAKLAVHDPELDIYIFVNRQGIKMRQLRRGELLALMDRGLVDILVTSSNFRSEVDRAREEDNE